MICLFPRGNSGLSLSNCRLIRYYIALRQALNQNPKYLINEYFEDTKYRRLYYNE